MHAVFQPALATQEWTLGLEPFLTKNRSPHNLTAYAGLIALCANTFPCFQLNAYSFVSLKPVHVSFGIWSIPLLLPVSCEEGTGSFCYSTRRVTAGQFLCVRCRRDFLAKRDQHSPLLLILVCLFSA